MGITEVTDPHRAMLESMRKAFGAPGDYGYGTAKGAALNALYSFLAARAKPSGDASDVPAPLVSQFQRIVEADEDKQALRALASVDGRANDRLLRDLLDAVGVVRSREQLRAIVARLRDRGLVVVEVEDPLLMVVALTEQGERDGGRAG